MKKAYDYFSNKHQVIRQQQPQHHQKQQNLQQNTNQNFDNPNGSVLSGDQSSRISHNVQSSDRRHLTSSIEPQAKVRDQHLNYNNRKAEIKDPSIISSAQVSAPNSLKNSKNNGTQSNYRCSSQIGQTDFQRQNSQNLNYQENIGLQVPQSGETIKMSRVKSYGNLSQKNSKQSKAIHNQYQANVNGFSLPQNQHPNQYIINKQNINNYFKVNAPPNDQVKKDNPQHMSREEATQLLLQYSSNYQKGLSSDISGLSIGTAGDQIATKRDSSPRFLQINLKMFNNYMTSGNNPQNSLPQQQQFISQEQQHPSQNNFTTIDGKIYDDESVHQTQITPQILQLLQQHQQNSNTNTITSSRERIRKARDPIKKSIQDDDTLNLISQVSKKSIELQQQIEKSKNNLSVDILAQANKQGGYIQNLHKMKALNMFQNQYTDDHQTQNQNTYSQSSISTNINAIGQTIQHASCDKKRPQSELQNAPLYQKCQQSLQNQNQQQRMSNSKLKPLNVEKPLNGFSNLSSLINSKTNQSSNVKEQNYKINNNAPRLGSYSSCSILQNGIKSSSNLHQQSNSKNIDESSILEEISPNQKNHVNVLVQLLDDKNKYIKQLLKKVDKLTDLLKKNQIEIPAKTARDNQNELETYRKGSVSRLRVKAENQSPTNNSKSRSQFNMQRAKSAALISNIQKSKTKNKKKDLPQQELENSFIQSINNNFDKVFNNLNQLKNENIKLMREVFINDMLSLSIDEDTSIEYPVNIINDNSRQESSQIQSNIMEDCNYVSVNNGGFNPNCNVSQDDSYQDYLNNADLDPNEELKREKSSDKRKVIKSSSNIKGRKSVSHSKTASVRASSKNTARGNGGSQSQMNSHQTVAVSQINHSMINQQSKKANPSQFKSNAPSHRPPTSTGIATNVQSNVNPKSKKIAQSNLNVATKSKKPSIASSSVFDNYNSKQQPSQAYIHQPTSSAFQSITSVRDNPQKQTISDSNFSRQNSHKSNAQQIQKQSEQYQIILDQLTQSKTQMKVKDKKIEKHKEFINKLKGSLEQVLVEHKKQAEQLESKNKELRALKCKLTLQ
eukprot:403355381